MSVFNHPAGFFRLLLGRYSSHRVSSSSAEVTYYLLFTMFPFIVFLYSVVTFLELPVSEILDRFLPVLPEDVYGLISDYLGHLDRMTSPFMLYAGSVMALYMLCKAISSLNYAVRRAYSQHRSQSRRRLIVSLLISFALMASVFLLLLLFGISRNVYHYIALFFELGMWVGVAADLIRYGAGPFFVFAILCAYYHIMDDRSRPVKSYIPGALFAVLLWYALSVGFMIYVNNFGGYTDLYGSVASVMVLMVWFNMTVTAFIMGAEINSLLHRHP
jgi:membrane protein